MQAQSMLCVAFLLMAAFSQAADVNVVGSWSERIGAADLSAGAGTDIRWPIESDPYQVQISIDNTGGGPWTLMVRRFGSNLPAGVTVAIRRTTGGSGDGVVGGESYVMVTEIDQPLFYGTGDSSGIGIQQRLDGVSIGQGRGDYSGELLYRVQ